MSALSTFLPTVIVRTFFISQAAQAAIDYGEVMQIVAFTLLFTSAVFTLFQSTWWLAVIPGIAAVSYWFMKNDTSNLEFYRYADWILTTPLMLVSILIANGSPLSTILAAVGLDFAMIGAGYKGITEHDMTWFWYGMAAFVPILYILLAQTKNQLAIYLTVGLWCLYPIVYYLQEIRTLTEEQVTMSYAFLDMCAKIGLVNVLHV